jgi:VanZ family protein
LKVFFVTVSFLHNPIFFKISKPLFWVLLLTVFYFAFSPKGDPLPDFLFADKLKHAAAFTVLGVLLWGGYRPGAAALFRWMLAVGIFIEAVQYFLPYRDASGWDLLADCAGILAALWLLERAKLT